MAQKFNFAILRMEVTRASRGLSATAELLVGLGSALSLLNRGRERLVQCVASLSETGEINA